MKRLMDSQRIKETLQLHKEQLFRKYPLRSIALFGSYASGTATEESDVDIMVEFSRPVGFEIVDLTMDLEELLHKRVDVVTRQAIKPMLIPFIQQQLQYV